jgi:hypothetical protein
MKTTYDELYVAVLRKERLHLLSLFDQSQEGTGHFNTAAGVLEHRIKEIENSVMEKSNA